MVNIHPKHTFVDENPYLVYNNENDATLDDVFVYLPTASADTLGGVKVGDGLSITEGGVLSASGGGEGGGGLVVHVDMQTFALDKKYSEIVVAAQVGYIGMLMQNGADEYDIYSLVGYGYDSSDGYCVFFQGSTSSVTTFAAEAEDGYPVAKS